MPFITSAIAAIGSAVTAVSGFVAGLGVVGKALLSLGLSMGLSALAGALGGPKSQAEKPGEISATLQVGGDIPRQVALGRIALRGHLAFVATAGIANERLCQLFILSDGWCDGIEAVWFGDQRHALEPLPADQNAVAKYWISQYGDTGFGDKRATIWFYDGRPGQGAPGRPRAFAPERVGPSDRWAGMAYVVVELINNNDTFDAIPDLLWELRGYRCHDPRKDPLFGGAGTHSLANPATWEFSENPAVHVWNYLRGIRSEGESFMGLELADYDLLPATFIAAANIAAELVPLEGGGSEPRYRASTVLTASEADHRAALAPLVQALAGYLIERNGAFGLLAGAAQLPVITITDADIDWTRGVTWQGSRSRTDRVNEVHGQFVDPVAQWQANSYPAITSSVYSAEDGERLAVQLDFGAITSVTQAQRAARIRMRETRFQASGSATLGFHLLWLEPGDWLRWTSATFKADKLYRLVSRDLNPDDTVTVALQEVGNSIYSWAAADEQPYLPPATAPGEVPLPSTVTGFAVQPDVIAGADGSQRPILRISWDPIADIRVVAVIIEYRRVGQVAATRVRDDSPYDGEFILDQPPTGEDYEFRASIATVPARPVTWTPWLPLSALDPARFLVDVRDLTAKFRAEMVWPPVLHPDVLVTMWNTSIQAMSADGKASASIKRIEQVSVTESEARATLGTQLNARMGEVEAEVTDVQTAVATNSMAIAAMSTTLTATVGTVDSLSGTVSIQAASIADLYSNKADASFALAINAKANAATAGGQFDLTASAGPGGATARIRARASATVGGTMVDAGYMIDVAGGVGTFTIFADRFVVVDPAGGNPFAPLSYSGGQWVLNGGLTINGNAVVNGTLSVFALATGSVGFGSGNSAGPLNLPNSDADTNWYDYSVSTITPQKMGLLRFWFDYGGTGGSRYTDGVRTLAFRILRRKGGVDTVVYGPAEYSGVFGTRHWFGDQPGAGSVQYVVQHRFVSQTGASSGSGFISRSDYFSVMWQGLDT